MDFELALALGNEARLELLLRHIDFVSYTNLVDGHRAILDRPCILRQGHPLPITNLLRSQPVQAVEFCHSSRGAA